MFDKRPRSRGGQYSQEAETAREDVRNLKSKGGNSRFRKIAQHLEIDPNLQKFTILKYYRLDWTGILFCVTKKE